MAVTDWMIWPVMSLSKLCKAMVLFIASVELARAFSIRAAIAVAARCASWDAALASSAPAEICSIALFQLFDRRSRLGDPRTQLSRGRGNPLRRLLLPGEGSRLALLGLGRRRRTLRSGRGYRRATPAFVLANLGGRAVVHVGFLHQSHNAALLVWTSWGWEGEKPLLNQCRRTGFDSASPPKVYMPSILTQNSRQWQEN